RSTLIWLVDDWYEVREQEEVSNRLVAEDQVWWSAWLADHASFAFRGKQGHLTLLKERRARGGDYWYAYRSVKHQTDKKYAGRSADLSISRLEEIARSFSPSSATPEQNMGIPQHPSEFLSLSLSSPTKPVQESSQPLLEPKFHAPRLSAALVQRERLLAMVDAALDSKLTLLCAPAGSGKTTLVGQWLSSRRAQSSVPPVAWISLESGDNDLLRFWRYVITACRIFHPTVALAALAQLASALQGSLEVPSPELILTTFLNDMALSGCSGLLVLEDYHVITEQSIHEMMIFFLDHIPSEIHIVILTRSEPPLPLSRWRARGELCEVRAVDLRFSPEETMRFFQQVLSSTSPVCSDETLAQLDRRVEGWAAGLRLLALALRGNRQLHEFERVIADFTGDHRTIQDYFLTEVFGVLPELWQDFLLQTSVLNRLTGELCDALTAEANGEQLLKMVERAGIFLEPLDETGEWYRYHALFSEAMRGEARRRLGKDAFLTLYKRASEWYEQHTMMAEAVDAAFHAQDARRAASLLEQMIEGSSRFLLNPQIFLETQGFHTFRRWLEQLPEEVLQERPLLCLGYATATLFVFVTEQIFPSWELVTKIERTLESAEAGFRREGDRIGIGEVLAFRALILRDQGELRQAILYATQALDYLPAEYQEGRNFSLSVIGTGKLAEGQLSQAHEIFLELFTLCGALGSNALRRANGVMLHTVDLEQGRLRQAEKFFRHMLLEAREENDIDDIAHAQLFLAQASYEANNLPESEQQAREALELGQRLGNEEFQICAALVLARIEYAHGQTEAALQQCATLLERFPAITALRHRLRRDILLVQARFQLASGNLLALQYWERERELAREALFAFQHEREELFQARWLLAQERADEAHSLLKRLLKSAEETERLHHALSIRIVLVRVKASQGLTGEARQCLQELLSLALPQGYLRLFLDEGDVVLHL
ncbi:MAG TPA: hypothetical protein VFN35_20460, partial [Ktedonobacteraceae bacterium]|nr:hypothetical protein [Ktedonobacteraceae bacterium]